MIYIRTDNKIMMHIGHTSQEVNNDTGYLPLCVRENIILMSNYKLYNCIPKMYGSFTLKKILLDDDNFDYTVDLTNPTDFANGFVKNKFRMV